MMTGCTDAALRSGLPHGARTNARCGFSGFREAACTGDREGGGGSGSGAGGGGGGSGTGCLTVTVTGGGGGAVLSATILPSSTATLRVEPAPAAWPNTAALANSAAATSAAAPAGATAALANRAASSYGGTTLARTVQTAVHIPTAAATAGGPAGTPHSAGRARRRMGSAHGGRRGGWGLIFPRALLRAAAPWLLLAAAAAAAVPLLLAALLLLSGGLPGNRLLPAATAAAAGSMGQEPAPLVPPRNEAATAGRRVPSQRIVRRAEQLGQGALGSVGGVSPRTFAVGGHRSWHEAAESNSAAPEAAGGTGDPVLVQMADLSAPPVPLQSALNLGLWHHTPLAVPEPPLRWLTRAEAPETASGAPTASRAGCPSEGAGRARRVRVLVAVISRCCDAESAAKRASIRAGWGGTLRSALAACMHLAFVLAQPPPERAAEAEALLAAEAGAHGDLVFVPGHDTYRNLPSKTLRMLQLVLSSPERYTHVAKVDDDVFLRPHALLYDVILAGWSTTPAAADLGDEGSLFVGGVSGSFSHADNGFRPVRDPASKWYLSPSELPDHEAPVGVPYPVGWAYVMSRDVAEVALEAAVRFNVHPTSAPPWWGRLPWEDVTMGALLQGRVPLRNHEGFRHPFMRCGAGTVAKHLDNLAPQLQAPLAVADREGRWGSAAADCTAGLFQGDNFTDWRLWRNRQPDVAVTGRI